MEDRNTKLCISLQKESILAALARKDYIDFLIILRGRARVSNIKTSVTLSLVEIVGSLYTCGFPKGRELEQT